ncbi:MAG: molybdopterin-dependent oxidoreductase [Planctomycetes bacterium]|nr:molybdopterin-dependent oxidoreductase [Planctomycetota bacterium]
MTNSIPEIRDVDLMFVIGSNTTEAHPIIGMELKRARRRGAKLIVADPRRIWLADHADVFLQLRPGTDVWLVNAMAQCVVQAGLVDDRFIREHTEGWEALRAHLAKFDLAQAEKITGVPAGAIREAALLYARTRKAGIYYTLGITEHTHGTDNVFALANLVLMTGHLGLRSAGMNPLRGQNNVQGATDAGASPIYYSGYQPVLDAAVQEKFSKAWGAAMPATQGKNLNVMMHGIETGEMKAMYIMGEDILLSEPDANVLEDGLKKLEFLVCQDIFLNLTTRYANVVFPGAAFAEKEGVFTNTDRRVQRVRKAVEPPGEARADWQILCDFARACGYPMPRYGSPADIYDEMAALSPRFAGISHKRLDATPRGLQWPCTGPDHPGTEFLHKDGVAHGKGKFQVVDFRPSSELPDADYPLVLTTGRVLYHYNAATQTRRDAGTTAKVPENFVEVHPDDAARLGVKDGEHVRVVSRRGGVKAKLWLSGRVQKGCVWMPLHFAEEAANKLTVSAGDAITGTAEYKVCAVSLVPAKTAAK